MRRLSRRLLIKPFKKISAVEEDYIRKAKELVSREGKFGSIEAAYYYLLYIDGYADEEGAWPDGNYFIAFRITRNEAREFGFKPSAEWFVMEETPSGRLYYKTLTDAEFERYLNDYQLATEEDEF
ncbi:MAG: hypothetical protein QXY76_03385 [Nitrososphaeria archaeon]